MAIKIYFVIIFLIMSMQFAGAATQEPEFQSITPEQAAKYHFNLSQTFYSDETAYQADMSQARKLADEIASYKGKATSTGKVLYDLIDKGTKFSILTQKMFIYRYLSYAINTKLEAQYSAADQEISALQAKTSFLDTELKTLTPKKLNLLIKQEPKLEPYRFYLEQNTRYKPYTLSADEEQMLSQLSPQLYSWEGQLFQKLIDRTKFDDVKTPSGTYNVYRDRQVLSKEKDRNVRKDAMVKLYDEYAGSADLFGWTVIKLATALNETASMRGFKDAFESSLFDSYLTKKQADDFYTTIGQYASLMQRYQKVRKARIKAISGVDSVEPWDMEVVPPDYKRPRFTIDQTADTIEKALAFHGQEYSTDMQSLLNPANGRLDIVTGQNRVPGAFAWGYYGAPFVFYSFAYHGYLDDVLTLAHEGGHVVHYDLISNHHVLPVYANGPQYFTESFAMFNEFVTANYLYQNSTSKDDKIYYLEQLLSVMMRRFFDIVMRSEFEYRAYEKIKAGEINDPEQLHQLWKQEGLRYIGEDYEKHEFLKYNWSLTPHFFTSPRYYINYLFANLMAINYFQRHSSDPKFDAQYVQLMENGFPDTPINLLQKYLKLDPFDPAAVKDSMQVFEQKLDELEQLYR